MSTQIEDRKSLASSISEIVQDNWNTNHSAILISAIGIKLRRAYPNFLDLVPHGLKRFIETNAAAQAISYPGIPEKIGLIPMNVTVPSDIKELFKDREINEANVFSVASALWKSFHTDISGKRYVLLNNVDHKFRVVDSLEDKSADEITYEISEDDLSVVSTHASIEEKTTATRKKVQAWLDKNGLTDRMFTNQTHRGKYIYTRGNSGSEIDKKVKNDSEILVGNWSKLDEKDLARISIPLDLLIKMMK